MNLILLNILILLFVAQLFSVEGVSPGVSSERFIYEVREEFIQPDDFMNLIKGKEPFSAGTTGTLGLGLGMDFKGFVYGNFGRKGRLFRFETNCMAERYRDFSPIIRARGSGRFNLRLKNEIIGVSVDGSFDGRELDGWNIYQGRHIKGWYFSGAAGTLILRRDFSLELQAEAFNGSHKNDLNWYPFFSGSGYVLFRYYISDELRAKFSLKYSLARIRDIMNDYLSEYSTFNAMLGLGRDFSTHYFELGALLNTSYNLTNLSPYFKAFTRRDRFELALEYSSKIELPVYVLGKEEPYVIPNISMKEEHSKDVVNISSVIYPFKFFEVKSSVEYRSIENQHGIYFTADGTPFLSNYDKTERFALMLELSNKASYFNNNLKLNYTRNRAKNGYQIPLVPMFTIGETIELAYKRINSKLGFFIVGRQETYNGKYIKPYPLLSFSFSYKWNGFKFGFSGMNLLNRKFEWYPGKLDTGSIGRLEFGYDFR